MIYQKNSQKRKRPRKPAFQISRDELQEHIRQFVSSGGQIKKLEPGPELNLKRCNDIRFLDDKIVACTFQSQAYFNTDGTYHKRAML